MIGLGAGLLFILFSILQVVRGKTGVGFWASLLAGVALAATLLALYLPQAPAPDTRLLAIALGGGLALVGLVLLFLERRRQQPLGQSRGLLGAGVGALILLGVVVGPYIARVVPTPAVPTAVAPQGVAAGDGDSVNLTAFSNPVAAVETPPVPVVSPTPQPAVASVTPLPPRPVLPTPTPTNTLVPLVTVDAEATDAAEATNAAETTSCAGIVQNNLNLRTEPSLDGAIQVTIPSGTTVSVDGATDDGWLSVTYGQMSGWVSGDYVLLGASCATLSGQTG